MDLGITGKTALVCASSKGLGRGCAEALAREGVRVVINGRDAERLEQTAIEIRNATGAIIIPVAADVSTEEGRSLLLEKAGNIDILVNNNGGPPPRELKDIQREDILAGIEASMLTPIALIQAIIGHMKTQNFGRIVNITSASVKMPLPMLDVSTGSRIGLTGFLAGAARQVVRHNVTINNLLPGTFDTDRILALHKRRAKSRDITLAEARADHERSIPAGRLGTIEEFGMACAFLCSVHAGYITGQNLLIDGGAYPGIM